MDRRDTHDSSVFAVPGQVILDLGVDIDGHASAMEIANEASDAAYCLVVVAQAASPPTSAQREALQPHLDGLLSKALATAIVIQGRGIDATTKRTLVRVMASFSHARKPFKVFSEIDEGLAWLREEAAARGHEPFAPHQVPANLGHRRGA